MGRGLRTQPLAPHAPYPGGRGEVPLLGCYSSSSVRSLCPACAHGDALARSLRTFHAFGRAPDSLVLKSVLGGSSAAESTCFRRVAGSLPLRAPGLQPGRPPNFPAASGRGVPRGPSRPPTGSREATPHVSAATPAGGAGTEPAPRTRWGSKAAAGEGRVNIERRSGSPGKYTRGAPCAPLWLGVASGWQLWKVRARLGSAVEPGATRAGTDGADRPPSVVFTGQRLARSDRGGDCGRQGRDGVGARRLLRFLPPPPRGVWAEDAGALSMVRRGAARPGWLCAFLPQVVLSSLLARSLSLASWPPGSRLSFLLSWVSPFVLWSPAGFSPLPPLASQPSSTLSRLWGFRTLRLVVFGLCSFGSGWNFFLLGEETCQSLADKSISCYKTGLYSWSAHSSFLNLSSLHLLFLLFEWGLQKRLG